MKNYTNRFVLHATEIHPDRAFTCRYPCHKGFRPDGEVIETSFTGVVLSEPGIRVDAVQLDHGTPVLAFALHERFHINILKAALEHMGLRPGAWLNHLKQMIYDGADPQTPVAVSGAPDDRLQVLTLGELESSIVRVSAGQHIAYITDAAGSPENIRKIIAIAEDVDQLFIEAAFSDRHHAVARQKHHLTAHQAGTVARACRAKQYHLFHFSPRYTEDPDLLEAEARAAFTAKAPLDRSLP